MADGKTLAKAYVQMIPTTDGFKSALMSQTEGGMDEAGKGLGSRLGSAIKNALMAAGIGIAIKSVIGSAISEGAALEQSIGGIETLFGAAGMSLQEYAASVGQTTDQAAAKYQSLTNAQDMMLANAQNAYKTAGLSANQYMEQASGFAASLVSSLGGDTEAAAVIANRAMIDMSDNANKMGTDIGLIQNAYQGFAKQNYTMLDNLKLGYGGTQAEMQRLIKDASQMTDVQEELGITVDENSMSFDNIANAISVVQKNMNIAGTTQKEAAETFSGSMQMVKAAYSNMVGYLANGMDKEAYEAMNNLIESVSVFLFDNALPMVGRFISKLPGIIASGLKQVTSRIRNSALEGTGTFIKTFAESLPALIGALAELLSASIGWIRSNWPAIKQMARDALMAFIDGLKAQWPELSGVFDALLPVLENVAKVIAAWKIGQQLSGQFAMIKTFITGIVTSFGALQTTFVEAGGGLSGIKALFIALNGPALAVGAILAAVVGAFATLWKTNEDFRNRMIEIWNDIVAKVQDFCQGIVDRINALGFDFQDITEVLSAVWQGFCDFMAPVFEGAWALISETLGVVLDLILEIWDVFAAAFSGDWEGFWTGIQGIVDTVWTFITDAVNIAIQAITNCIQTFLSWFGIQWDGDLQGIQTTWQLIWDNIKIFLDAAVGIIRDTVGAFIALFNGDWGGFCQGLSTAWDTLWNVVKTIGSNLWNAIKDAAKTAFDNIKRTIMDVWDSIKKKLGEGWDAVKSALSNAWNGIKNTASKLFNDIKQAICRPFEEAKNLVSGIWDWLTGHKDINVNVKTNYDYGDGGRAPVGRYAVGGIFNEPTFFPDPTGKTGGHIVGEAGAEAVLPLSGFYRNLDASISAGYEAISDNPRLARAVELLERIADKPVNVYINKNRLISEIYQDVDERIKRRDKTLAFVGGIA